MFLLLSLACAPDAPPPAAPPANRIERMFTLGEARIVLSAAKDMTKMTVSGPCERAVRVSGRNGQMTVESSTGELKARYVDGGGLEVEDGGLCGPDVDLSGSWTETTP